MDVQVVKLAAIIKADFRKSDLTIYREHIAKMKLAPNHAVLVISSTNNQLLWYVHKPTYMWKKGIARGQVSKVRRLDAAHTLVLDTRRWRIVNGEWSPAMIQNYANAVGLYLTGLERIEIKLMRRRAR